MEMDKDIFTNIKPYIQDSVSLGIALFVCVAIYYYIKTKNTFLMKIAGIICILYSLFDLYNGATIDFWIHHIAQIVLCTIMTIWPNEASKIMIYIYYCFLVEVSSIFFSFRSLIRIFLKNNLDTNTSIFKFIKQFQPINEILFFVTFLYTRLYLFNKHVVFNPECYDTVNNAFDFYMTNKMLLGSTAILSVINLYWSSFLTNKFINKVFGYDIYKYKPDPNDPILIEIETIKSKILNTI
jgi:hypothetical protein